MEDHTAATGGADAWDTIIRKYATIWIWSILCATVGTRLFGASSGALLLAGPLRFGTGNMVDAQQVTAFFASFLSLTAELVALWYLYLFFRACLLPLLFSGADPAASEDGPRFLRGAFVAILCGLAAPVAGSILGFFLRLMVAAF
jgi:hypothetical protein